MHRSSSLLSSLFCSIVSYFCSNFSSYTAFGRRSLAEVLQSLGGRDILGPLSIMAQFLIISFWAQVEKNQEHILALPVLTPFGPRKELPFIDISLAQNEVVVLFFFPPRSDDPHSVLSAHMEEMHCCNDREVSVPLPHKVWLGSLHTSQKVEGTSKGSP